MFEFNARKTMQAVGVLLRMRQPRGMGRLRLLKLLYLADRQSLREIGAPITGDRAYAMDNGPVLSETYDMIKGEHVLAPEWSEHFENIGYFVHLVKDPGAGLLSRYEIETLNRVSHAHELDDDSAVAQETHKFPEWRAHHRRGSSTAIPFEDILTAVGRAEEIGAIRKHATAMAQFNRMFGKT